MRISIQDIGKKESEAPEIHQNFTTSMGQLRIIQKPTKSGRRSFKIVTRQNEKTLLQQCSRV
ncbi:MAG: hypothetical protein DIZ78_00260 [endosymbiont of Escarpia spicata]|uniref:Uncharacterized protein n=1 Tax=endosymbiont of Escarpia spicata TaxID=2200908 RepID=A0A370DUT7_9GAMM|nr:MAG: hypothetical protein DIZ78_00260 [endosymbiont of Escarpia spicata]